MRVGFNRLKLRGRGLNPLLCLRYKLKARSLMQNSAAPPTHPAISKFKTILSNFTDTNIFLLLKLSGTLYLCRPRRNGIAIQNLAIKS